MIIVLLLAVVILILTYGYIWARQRQTYWKRHKIPYIESFPLLGHFARMILLQENIADTIRYLYNHPNAKEQPFIGINVFHKPAILLRDPDLIKQIGIKDSNYFTDHHTGADPLHDPVGGNNLFQLKNPVWRKLRAKLSPIFTSGKMKQMFYMVDKVGNDLNEKLKFSLTDNSVEVECHALFGCFTTDVISLVAFATEANCVKDPEQSEFFLNAKKSLMSTSWDKICFSSVFLLPELYGVLSMRTFGKSFEDFMRRLFNEVMDHRLKYGGTRNDLIDALIAIQNSSTPEEKAMFTEDVILAQAAVFFVAGYETSSATLSFVMYHIAKYKDVQQKLREELKKILLTNNSKVTYENITQEMPYLHAVILETLRFYPVLSFLDRECRPPNHETHYSMEPFSSFKIPSGMPVYIPTAGLHMDPQYFPDPKRFDPNRFLDLHAKSFNEYAFSPFGVGPRICIGERFALMQMKMAIINVMRSFIATLSDKMPPGELQLDKTTILLHSQDGVHVVLTKDELC